MGREAGVTEAQIEGLASFEDSSAFGERERAALRLADAMSRTPAEVPEPLFAQLRRHFTGPQLVELAHAIAWENHRARFNRTFDVEAEGFSGGAACPLPLPPEAPS